MAARDERTDQPPTDVTSRARNKDVSTNTVNSTLCRMPRPHRLVVALVVAVTVCVAATVYAQRRRGGFGGRGGFGFNAQTASPKDFDGLFHFCRIVFRNALEGDGGGWSVDWPRADINLSIRLSELTKLDVSKAPSGEPNHLLIRLTDPALFDCPFVMMTEPGGAGFDDQEAAQLRLYLEKGGFLWADDFWGEYAWNWWVGQLRKALPASEFPIFDLAPDHPLLHTQFEVKKIPQIPSINFFFGTHQTSERGADSAVPHARAIADKNGRVMVLMTHNTDFGDAFEREGDDATYFLNFGPDGYAFGINAVLYALTH
jgi:hypothetical protein